MSNEKINIYWLDDDNDRFNDYKSLIESSAHDYGFDANVHTVLVDDGIGDLILDWERTLLQPAPDLFMLDHIFNRTLPHKLNGNTLAHILRRTFTQIPLISVTAMHRANTELNNQDVEEYTALIKYNELSNSFEDLFVIAKDYKRVNPNSVNDFISLIGAPESENEMLQLAIPQEYLRVITPSKRNQLVRWMRSNLLSKPGFLYDELHAATFLGLTCEGFDKVKNKFQSALYRGPFQLEKRPLWWVSNLRDQLYKELGADAPDSTQKAGRLLINDFKSSDFCKCYVSGEGDAIDFVVAEKYPYKTLEVVRMRHSTQSPELSLLAPGFDQLLIVAGQ